MNKYGNVSIITGLREKNSPCCDMTFITKYLSINEHGFGEAKYFCSKCGKEDNAIEVTFFDGNKP